MPEQLVSRQTLNGWLNLLAALTLLEEAPQPTEDLVDLVPFPVAVLDLGRRSVFVMSPHMRSLLGLERGARDLALHQLVATDGDLTLLLDLLRDGSIDAYEVLRRLRRADGESLEAQSWVSVCQHHERRQRQHAIWVVAPVGEDPGRCAAAPATRTWPDRVEGLVIGTLDAGWCIETVSVDIEGLLGYAPGDAVGRRFIDVIHPDDVPAAFNAAAYSIVDHAGVGFELRIRHGSGDWLTAHAILTALADGQLSFGFVLAVPTARQEADPTRVADLERRLLRIAHEVEAAGVAAGFETVPDPRALPGLAELSARQWEILSRLLRGERVPTIAARLYISQSTVRNHLSQIFRRLGVHSQEELLEVVRAATRARAREV